MLEDLSVELRLTVYRSDIGPRFNTSIYEAQPTRLRRDDDLEPGISSSAS